MFCTQAGPGCSTRAELGLAQAPGDTWGQGGSPWGPPVQPPRARGGQGAPWASKSPRGQPSIFYIQPSALSSSRLGGGGGRGEKEVARMNFHSSPTPTQRDQKKKKRFKSKTEPSAAASQPWSQPGHCCSSPFVTLPGEGLEWRPGFATKCCFPSGMKPHSE